VRHLLALGLVSLLAGVAVAGPTLPATKVAKAPPIIDGEVLADRAWTGVPTAVDFRVLGKNTSATQTTQGRVLYDDRNVYVAFVCQEAALDKLVARTTKTDGPVWEDDCVEVFLAPYANRNRYYHFVVNSRGVLRDELGQDEKWNSGARAAAKLGKGAWSAELAIPLSALDLDETTGTTWGLNLCREERPSNEVSSWAPCTSSFHDPASFGDLTGIEPNLVPFLRTNLGKRIEAARTDLRSLRDGAEQYRQLEAGTVVQGGCNAQLVALDGVQKALGRRLDAVKARELGKQVAQVEAEVPVIRARAAKLPLLQAAGRRGYVVCQESAMAKVRPDRPYNGQPSSVVEVTLARNEYEAAQLVVVPIEETLRKVVVSVSDLTGPQKAKIAADAVKVNVVGYVNVTKSTSRAPMPPGEMPDPLLANEPTDVDRARVQSWWITVHTAPNQAPGLYRGEINVRPQNAPSTRIPFQVRVWGFALPTASRLRSSYGINMSSVLSRYELAAGPGQPSGWIAGAWTGADASGRENYFGSMDYSLAFDTESRRSGKRACRVTVTRAEKGVVESPRFCYYTPELSVDPNTDYALSVWYRTAIGSIGGPSLYVSGAGEVALKPTDGQWAEGTYTFNSKDLKTVRVYLRVTQPGTYWFDDCRLAPVGAGRDVNLLPNPDFERGEVGLREKLQDAYLADMLAHRASPTSPVGPKIATGPGGVPQIDWTDFDQQMQSYIDRGLNAFNVFWCRLPSGWGKVEGAEDAARIQQARELLRQTQGHLEEKGWTHLAYIYTIDEPGAAAFPGVKAAFSLAHEAAPKLKTLLTYGYGASKPIEPGAPRYADLEGFVDIHVPHTDCFEPIYLAKRQAAGDEIWAYVCISAPRPYLNCWAIDQPGLDHRLLFWQLYQRNITGFLYWQINYWQVDPWKDTMTYPGGNGDGSLIYPGPDGPVDSIRWELTRDGTEDYDMLVMLRDALAAAKAKHIGASDALLKLDRLTKSWTEYTDDPKALESQRLMVGNQLDLLSRVVSH
jgi:hypothetical protein